jgi:hypothetical protein
MMRDEALVLIDPALHANPPNFGRIVLSNNGRWDRWEKLSIDTTTLTDGKHRLLIGGCDTRPDGKNCGVLVVPFTVSNSAPVSNPGSDTFDPLNPPVPRRLPPTGFPATTSTVRPTPPAGSSGEAPQTSNRVVLGAMQRSRHAAFRGSASAVAGRPYFARVPVTDVTTGAAPMRATVTCSALAGRAALRARARFGNGYATCTWRVPRTKAGRLMRGSIRVEAGAKRASRSFSTRIRAAKR